MSTVLVWLRRDLRLADQPALRAAVDTGSRVIPAYIHAPDEDSPWSPGAASRWWLHHSLASLDAALQACGSRLVIRHGPSLSALRRLLAETGARGVYWNRLVEPAARQRDAAVESALRKEGIDVQTFNASLLVEPGQVRTKAGEPFRVFTPFWRAAQASLTPPRPLPAPTRIPAPGVSLASESPGDLGLLPRHGWGGKLESAWTPGEAGAFRALDLFCDEALAGYQAGRDQPGTAGTSRLSPHLHFGEMSAGQVVARIVALQSQKTGPGWAGGSETFLKELGWREFASHLLFHFPRTTDEPMDARFARMRWKQGASGDLARWQQGQTGFPIVDAGMRELWATGWMHNRVRMIVASLLTKNLMWSWQDGARWFWDTLVDADLASNTLGWQWVAGCGADAAPFFRIFNPVLQSRRFDPDGAYLRRWVPELSQLDNRTIHAPWEAADPPSGYPPPMVDLKDSRARALTEFQRLKATG